MKKYNHQLGSYDYSLKEDMHSIDIALSIFQNRRYFLNQIQFDNHKIYGINLFALNYFKADRRDFLRVKK